MEWDPSYEGKTHGFVVQGQPYMEQITSHLVRNKLLQKNK